MNDNEPATHLCRCAYPHWQLGNPSRCMICGGYSEPVKEVDSLAELFGDRLTEGEHKKGPA